MAKGNDAAVWDQRWKQVFQVFLALFLVNPEAEVRDGSRKYTNALFSYLTLAPTCYKPAASLPL